MTRAGRGKDKLEGRMEDEIEGREGRKKSVHRGWIGRGLGRRKDRDQNMATGKGGGKR